MINGALPSPTGAVNYFFCAVAAPAVAVPLVPVRRSSRHSMPAASASDAVSTVAGRRSAVCYDHGCRNDGCRLLAHRRDRGEYPDIAVVPIAAEGAAGRQFVVTEPFSAKVPDSHAAAKMEERIVRTDWNSAGVQVAQLHKQVGWKMSYHMLLNLLADRLRDLRPQLLRR